MLSLFCFVFFFTSAKDLHNSALTVLRANKSERRQFGGGSKDPRGWFTAARLAAVQGSSHQRSLDPSSSRHKLSSKPLFFFFFYTPTTTQRVKHISQRANAAAAALCWHSLETHYSFQKGWIWSGGVVVGGGGRCFAFAIIRLDQEVMCNCLQKNHLSDDSDATCSHPIGGQSPALCFWVVFWFKWRLFHSAKCLKRQLSHAGLCQAISGKKGHKVLKWLRQCSQPLAGTSFFRGVRGI